MFIKSCPFFYGYSLCENVKHSISVMIFYFSNSFKFATYREKFWGKSKQEWGGGGFVLFCTYIPLHLTTRISLYEVTILIPGFTVVQFRDFMIM